MQLTKKEFLQIQQVLLFFIKNPFLKTYSVEIQKRIIFYLSHHYDY